MDPRGASTAPLSSPLAELGARTGQRFEHLMAARERTAHRLAEAQRALAGVECGPGVSVVLMGSWGRSEVTSGSDADVLVVGTADDGAPLRPAVAELEPVLGIARGTREVFNREVHVRDLARIGAEDDDVANLTRRLLLLVESVPVLGADAHHRALRTILDAYLRRERRDRRPPRFLLNDLIRYWRTIAVEFEGKGDVRWALRHAKLRTSRTVLFAGGLLPVLECHHVVADDVAALLLAQFALPPTDRLAAAFLNYDAADAGARTLGAYDEFLGLLDDPEARAHLGALGREEAAGDEVFNTARRLGREIQQGLLALLFEREPLRRLIRQYGVL
jgi:predicted nucleotidyltransferase